MQRRSPVPGPRAGGRATTKQRGLLLSSTPAVGRSLSVLNLMMGRPTTKIAAAPASFLLLDD